MVYNAMKLFMEINPQLFDDCSHDYTELQNSAEDRKAHRQSKWDALAELAKKNQARNPNLPQTLNVQASRITPFAEEIDPTTQDSQRRLDALRLQDDGNAPREYSAVSI